MITFPGLIWQQDFPYNTRFPYGQDGTIKVVSYPAAENIPPGVLVQIKPGTETLQVARDATSLVGVSVYDPQHFDSSVIYNQYDVVPVMRRGSCFAEFITNQAPYADPRPEQTAAFYPGAGLGQFTTDAAGTLLPRITFSIASLDYYKNTDGSPQADIQYPIEMPPLGVTDTTFGAGVCLLEVNL